MDENAPELQPSTSRRRVLCSTTPQQSSDPQTNTCCVVSCTPWIKNCAYPLNADVLNRFYGCGFPIPEALDGRDLDYGCGTGRRRVPCQPAVGPTGHVHTVSI